MEFVPNSYCYPEQNYLTKRYSGKWKFIEFAFQSWSRDPCNSFGIHMAAFNPKPWFKQPTGTLLKTDDKYEPYKKEWDKKNIRFPIAIEELSGKKYDNISFSYEIFNEVIIWGLVNFPELHKFFIHETQIHGTKVSFDRDIFKQLIPKENIQYKYLKEIKKGDKLYKKLSKSQKLITNLINDYDKHSQKIKGDYLQNCREKIKNKDGEYDYNFKIINYPNYQTAPENEKNNLLEKGKFPYGKNKGKLIKDLDDEYIQKIIKMNAYKKDPILRKAIIKTHKKKIQSLQKKGGRKKK